MDAIQFLIMAVLIAADTIWLRFSNPSPVEGLIVAGLAFFAIAVNMCFLGKALEKNRE